MPGNLLWHKQLLSTHRHQNRARNLAYCLPFVWTLLAKKPHSNVTIIFPFCSTHKGVMLPVRSSLLVQINKGITGICVRRPELTASRAWAQPNLSSVVSCRCPDRPKSILVLRSISVSCFPVQAIERDIQREEPFEQLLQLFAWRYLCPNSLHFEYAFPRLDATLVR